MMLFTNTGKYPLRGRRGRAAAWAALPTGYAPWYGLALLRMAMTRVLSSGGKGFVGENGGDMSAQRPFAALFGAFLFPVAAALQRPVVQRH